ncbi:hypothetical protein PVL29_016659 [Vitis rotundifolia]|uniref:Telomere repeat-binding protein 1-6-like ubiquitin-like domain-containing protein n=1 Tax=Vitis rotundifolia TaxID=103349 RepID=A0AA39DHZ6_VITRO|nr:hypothetical protein PVL29_016659 [Vitis rotundifolia]
MVLKKKQDYGFNGFHVSTIPRAPRSIRRRGSVKKPVDDSQICAIDLLATLAGKLLQESESSSASSNVAAGKDRLNISKDGIKQKLQHDDKPLKGECLDQGSCEGIVFVSELASQDLSPKYTVKQFPHAVHDAILDCTSAVASSDYLDKVGCDVKMVTCKSKNIFGKVPCKVERGSPDCGETCGDLESGAEIRQEAEGKESGGLTMANRCSSKDSVELCMKNPVQINSDSNVKLSLNRDSIPNASFPKHRNDVKIGIIDDDENSYRCNQHGTKIKAFRSSPCIGDQRIRKLLTSRYWKVAPKLKDCELSNTDGGKKPVFRKRKTCGTRKRYQRGTTFKRRKLFERHMVVASDGGISSESVTNSPEKNMNTEMGGSAAMLHGASGLSSSVISHQASFNSGGSHVKFSIKSFRVPELFIEVPESATIGALKRTVMEAVNSIFGGGLHVGMFLQGKKVRDDYRTLRQTGISHSDNLDTLGFALEPSPIHSSPPLHTEDPPFLLPSDTSQLLTRSPDPPTFDSGFSDATPDPSPLTNLGNQVEKIHDSVPSPTDILTDKTMPDSRALVAVPAMSLEALAVVPMNMKTNRADLVQRRTRRPFSVSEVEALVHAVEELGTGRWRDVKLRAFDNAKHRTYVDLKVRNLFCYFTVHNWTKPLSHGGCRIQVAPIILC